jgi:hypothetical protein
MRDRLPDFAILQPPKDHLEIKMAEDRVKYVLDRYAIQKIMAVLSESLAVDDNTQKFLAEAERRGLAAIVTVTRAFIDYSRENRQRPDLKTKRSERGFGDGD